MRPIDAEILENTLQAAIVIQEGMAKLLDAEDDDGIQMELKTYREILEEVRNQPELVRCKDCIHWTPGVITDTDDFIPPRCLDNHGVGWHANDFCSYGEKKEGNTEAGNAATV